MSGESHGIPYGVRGRIVTMDAVRTVVPEGVVYVEGNRIAAVTASADPRPPGFEQARVLHTRGTIYPGLIELHNHLAYDVLRLWNVPTRYTNREQWRRPPEYRKRVTGPMLVLGKSPGLMPAVARYVECKCLVAGTTATQGLKLFSNSGAQRYFRGVVRNVEDSADPALPDAGAVIADVPPGDAPKLAQTLARHRCFLLHLSEGTDAAARQHFLDLRLPDGRWAITDALSGIHAVALTREDFATLASRCGSVVWSPLSNLLLYGATADIAAAKASGITIGLGSDWSFTGSKNLLGELKVARLVSDAAGGLFSDSELVAMATCNAAAILKWSAAIGSLEVGKRADLLVIAGASKDPYGTLIEAQETDVRLVAVDGVARFGTAALVGRLGIPDLEAVLIGGEARVLNVVDPAADPSVGTITFAEARETLTDALRRLPELARELERAPPAPVTPQSGAQDEPETWFLALDELADPDVPLSTSPSTSEAAGDVGLQLLRDPVLVSDIVEPLELDPLTVKDDPDWLDGIEVQPNLPDAVRTGLRKLHR